VGGVGINQLADSPTEQINKQKQTLPVHLYY